MKLLVVLSSILLIVNAINPELEEAMLAGIKKMGGECKTETGASDDDIEPIKTHGIPTTPKGKCFLACLFQKVGSLDSQGKIDPEGIRASIQMFKENEETAYNQLKQVTENCISLVKDEDDKCETAVEMLKCSEREKKAVGFKNMDLEF